MVGGNLKDRLAEGPFTMAQTLKVVGEVGGALAVAHRSGVIHRDIKPANILLDDAGNAYLSDFGIAKDLAGNAEATRTGKGFGTPAYMAPEQLRSEPPPSPQTDIYALGLLVYEMVAGSHPFESDSLVRVIDAQLTEPVPALEGGGNDVPAGIDAVLTEATQKSPTQRFASVGEFLDALDEIGGAAGRADLVAPMSAPNPFKGLRAFQESDAVDFFGRTALIDRLVGRLDGERFLAVIGPSGSGKSSVVRAGLIPALRRGALDGSEGWLIADFTPGPRPFLELEAALLRVAVNPPATLLEQLRRDPDGLRSAIKRILPPDRTAAGDRSVRRGVHPGRRRHPEPADRRPGGGDRRPTYPAAAAGDPPGRLPRPAIAVRRLRRVDAHPHRNGPAAGPGRCRGPSPVLPGGSGSPSMPISSP